MYLPYLRGKQFELLALRELLNQNKISSNFVQPIFEPIKETSTFKNTLKCFNDEQYPLYTVINPSVGDFEKHENDHPILLDKSIQYDAVLMSDNQFDDYSILSESNGVIPIFLKADDLDRATDIFTSNLPITLNLIKDSSRLKREMKRNKQKVGIIRDAFEKKDRNVDYTNIPDEFFSDDHLYYKEEGYVAFSDFSIVGESYSESGFAPVAVAIHIVYFDSEDVLRIKHFVSDSNDDISNPAGKFSEALEKLVQWSNNLTKKNRSLALDEFESLHNNRRYPGLGVVKKLSIMHHIEIMNNYLNGVQS